MDSPSSNWGCCSARGKADNFMQCSKCNTAYHYACVYPGKTKQPSGVDFLKTWICFQCKEATPKAVKNDNTPVRQGNSSTRSSKRQAVSPPRLPSPNLSPNKATASPITRNQVREIMEEVLQKHMSQFKKQFTAELVTVKDEIKKAMDFMDSRIEDIVKVQNATQAQVKLLQDRESQMQSKIMNLEARVNVMEQNARHKNIEIQCAPENKSENLISIVEKLGVVIGCTIKEENILRITRTAKQDPKSKRPRSIVVEFNTQLVRNEFLASTIQYNRRHLNDKLNSTHLGHSGPKLPIYVSEHLSPYNKALHAATRRAAKEKGYEFVWTRGGRIFMRKDATSEYIVVRDMSTIAKLK